MDGIINFIENQTIGDIAYYFLFFAGFGYWVAFICKQFHELASKYGIFFYLFVVPVAIATSMLMLSLSAQHAVVSIFLLIGFHIRFFGVKHG